MKLSSATGICLARDEYLVTRELFIRLLLNGFYAFSASDPTNSVELKCDHFFPD